jgi:pyridoxamine 5'-phosphate oxidase family protein
MSFSDAELAYLASQRLGRLATVQPDGTPQVNPVGFRYNPATGTIDIGGFNLAASRKFRNVAANGRAAFVVDDIASVDPWRVRCVEIRGHAEAITAPADSAAPVEGPVIRIHPRRIISFGVEGPDRAPHELVASKRGVAG